MPRPRGLAPTFTILTKEGSPLEDAAPPLASTRRTTAVPQVRCMQRTCGTKRDLAHDRQVGRCHW